MELDQIRAFLAVAKHGTISRAAQELYRTQPAISLRLRALEAELGHRLLERGPRGIALTPAGEIFRRRSESIFAEVQSLQTQLSDLAARRTGSVTLGASDTVCLYLLPKVLKRFVQKYPGIELQLFTQISRQVLQLVRADQADLGIVTLPADVEGLESRILYKDRFLVVFPRGDPFAGRRILQPEELRGRSIIHLKPDTITRNWIDACLEPFGLKSQVRMEVSTIEVIKRLVEVGLGISLLPEMAVVEEVRQRRLGAARLRGVPMTRTMGLVYRREKYLSLALQAFLDILAAHAGTV